MELRLQDNAIYKGLFLSFSHSYGPILHEHCAKSDFTNSTESALTQIPIIPRDHKNCENVADYIFETSSTTHPGA